MKADAVARIYFARVNVRDEGSGFNLGSISASPQQGSQPVLLIFDRASIRLFYRAEGQVVHGKPVDVLGSPFSMLSQRPQGNHSVKTEPWGAMQDEGSSVGRGSRRRTHFPVGAALVLLALALTFGLGRNPRRYSASVPGPLPSPGEQADEQAYYANALTILDLPLAELVADFPELQVLQPATDQQQLPTILGKVGTSVERAYQNLTSVAADEQITQQQYGYGIRVKSTLCHQFSYLIIASHELANGSIREYRTGPRMKPVESQGVGEDFAFTKDFASMWVLFYPENQSTTSFRFLGQQASDGRNLDVVCFAERPGRAVVTGRLNAQGRSALLLYQGVAWIDPVSFRIVRMRLDLLEPRLDVALERQTTEIRFGEVRIRQAAAELWLPQEVIVTTVYNGQLFQNRHVYSNFRLFVVNSEIKPAEPEQPHPPD